MEVEVEVEFIVEEDAVCLGSGFIGKSHENF
jgi:hypothetical protein